MVFAIFMFYFFVVSQSIDFILIEQFIDDKSFKVLLQRFVRFLLNWINFDKWSLSKFNNLSFLWKFFNVGNKTIKIT